MTEIPTDQLDELDPRDAEEVADDNRPYGEVTAEDLSTDDLVQDGADAAFLPGEDQDLEGEIPLDHAIELDRDEDETIDDRVKQEIPDPATDIVPKD